ncbi:MAG: DUF4003 domain-containing protein [Lachnospiraceae bacterium]|nr:DUF4003 domain-containing protein [Lachnospiraceae bacterium]
MNERTLARCKNLIKNKETMKSAFAWEDGLTHLACAGIFINKEQTANEEMLLQCKDILKRNTGIFSNFKSTAKPMIVAMLAANENPQLLMERGLKVYDLLKEEFMSSVYLPIAAMIIAQYADEARYAELAQRTRRIYKQMRADHPFLTSGEDSTFCALMALLDKPDEVLLGDAEECYKILKNNFFSSNAVQSLSHVLAMCDGEPEIKCQKTMELFQKLKEAGHKYGTSYELPTLGVLAMADGNQDEIAAEMAEIDQWLSEQKGFGFFSSISAKQRLMYAGMIAQRDYINDKMMQGAAVNGVISLIVAQQAAMCAAITASAAATANNNNS